MTTSRPDEEPARQPEPLVGNDDVERFMRTVGSAVSGVTGEMRERAAAAEVARDAVLASDADRDAVVRTLSDAFAAGRLSSDELADRAGRALAARTHGELDDLLAGLGGYGASLPTRPWRKAAFGVVAFFMSPFVLFGTLFVLSGSDWGDRVFGLVLLTILVPGLLALWRWAWPKR